MALESVSAAETLIQSNDNDLEDGEIPSDEDDEPVTHTTNNAPEAAKPMPKPDLTKSKTFEPKFNKNKKQQLSQGAGKHERFLKYKGPTEDWAGDVEKALKAAMEEDGGRNQEIKLKNKNNRNKARKRIRDEREEDRGKEQKKRKISDDENGNDDEDEMLFVRGASPIRKDSQEVNSPRRANEHETFENAADFEERPNINRHRENESKRGSGRGGGGRRGGKNERGKNKTRGQMRNDRNGRRQQNNDHGHDPDTICLYYMQGKCHKGDDCPFSHNALPPRKMELCKFYLMDCCAKREKCLYMHQDFPCKFFHTGLKCNQGDNCKFSHQPLSDQVKAILLKHLESAPKEILGDFPRLSREGAILMINKTARSLAQGQDTVNQKIPSLFELNLSAPTDKNDEKDDKDESIGQQKVNMRERKLSGKRTRWGSDEDRVPYEQIMLLQSANELCLQLPNVALGLAQQHSNTQLQQKHLAAPPTDFYAEINTESNKNVHKTKEDFTKDIGEDEILEQSKKKNRNSIENLKDIDLRQMLKAKKLAPVYSIADEVANLTKNKVDDESDQDEESDLVIEMPVEDDDKEKVKHAINQQITEQPADMCFSAMDEQEAPPHLPKKAQELFMRIQQQQRAAQDSFKNMDNDTDAEHVNQVMEDWYSEEEDDDDDDDSGNLTIVDSSKDEIESTDKSHNVIKEEFQATTPATPNVPQPAAIVDKLGDLSKIDISAEVSKLLSTLKAQSSTGSKTQQASGSSNQDTSKAKSTQDSTGETSSPRVSPDPTPALIAPVSRDPRMSRDPRQRRDEQKPSSPSISDSKRDLQKHLRLETSIYSSGITPMDTHMDTDLRTKDQDLRRQDMDFRQRFQTGFGDTDLRVVGAGFTDSSMKSDVDLRQILSLPFKPAPSHMPCTEIDASIASHPPMTYKVYIVDIPRPDYTGLKLTKNDAQVKYDPRLRKIFRIGKTELVADSPMSPPPAVIKQDTPKSPPQIRSDPRRKTLEAAASNQSAANANAMMSKQPQPMDMGPNMGLGPGGMPVPPGMSGGPPPNIPGPGSMMPLGPNHPMGMGNMGPMRPMMNAPMPPPMGMPPSMGMNGPPMPMPQGQMNYDPRFNVQRNNGVGLLGPGPGPGNFGPDANNSYEGGAPPYGGANFNNFGPGGSGGGGGGGGGPGDSGMMGFNPNASNQPNFMGDGTDWVPGSGNRRGGRIRRRNRNRTNMVANN